MSKETKKLTPERVRRELARAGLIATAALGVACGADKEAESPSAASFATLNANTTSLMEIIVTTNARTDARLEELEQQAMQDSPRAIFATPTRVSSSATPTPNREVSATTVPTETAETSVASTATITTTVAAETVPANTIVETTPKAPILVSEEEEISYWDQPYTNAAKGENGVFQLMDSDSNVSEIDLSAAEGFTPDAELRLSDIEPKVLDPIPDNAADFQAYLNAELNGFQPLAGYTDGTNDYNQYFNHESGPQVPMYSWMVHTGEYAELPGIGRVEGGPGRAVLVLIINRTDNVYRFPTNSVHVEAGFQGWGRIWNGEPDHVQETEQRLINHYRTRLGQGVLETGFVGQCDLLENCEEVTVVTVERMQWGNHEDGTPRYQFRLIRAETVSTP